MTTLDPRDAFDAAMIPGMRDRLAEAYARFREAERIFVSADSPTEVGGSAGTYVERDCPSCDSPSPAFGLVHAHGFDIVECPMCHFIYARQVMDERMDASRYRDLDLGGEAVRLRELPAYLELETKRARYYLDRIRATGARIGRLLEIGSGTGTLLLEAEQAGWQSLGMEPGAAAAAVARRRGANVLEGYFPDDLLDPHARFDVVAILDVLEHFSDPRHFLRLITAHLAPGGRLVIQVPNWESLLVRIEGAKSSTICPRHWSYFTPSTLRALLASLGFRDLLLQTVQTELDRIRAFPSERIAAAMLSLRPDEPAIHDLNSSEQLHRLELGYKLFGIFIPYPE